MWLLLMKSQILNGLLTLQFENVSSFQPTKMGRPCAGQSFIQLPFQSKYGNSKVITLKNVLIFFILNVCLLNEFNLILLFSES